jgi:glycosyltransferase involved in cell wall biosynthesis
MTQPQRETSLLFVVPSLSEQAAQQEDVVQLLLFAATRLSQAMREQPVHRITATILSVEPDTGGWRHLSSLFSATVRERLSVAVLSEPAIPNLAIASHKPAYHLFEYLKSDAFTEVHSLDRNGLLYYPTQAKQLGLYFLDTVFAVHVVGGTIFRREAEDALLEQVGDLMDDLLERGSLERADVIYVHDRKAWAWYANKLATHPHARIYDLAWPINRLPVASLRPTPAGRPAAILYFGALSADGGLPLFCSAIDRLLPQLAQPVQLYFVGSAQAIGGMDAVSYLQLRSAKWGVPVTIKRELTIAEEVALLNEVQGIVVCNTLRREGLRARLVSGCGLSVIQVTDQPASESTPESTLQQSVCAANPNQLAALLKRQLAGEPLKSQLLAEIAPSPPLAIVNTDGPKVSVCITHFRRPQKLRLALASLKAQSYQNFEVLVIDDGSPEPEVQRELAKISAEIEPLGWRLLVQPNRYLGAARNYGASQATGDYLLFMDDDNVAKPDEISTLVAVALRTGSDLVTCFFDAFESEQTVTENQPPPLRLTPFGSDSTLGILSNCFGDANALYARPLFERLGGFTEDYGITHEDWEFFCRAALEGAKLVCVPEPLFWYRLDPGGMYRGQNTQLHKNANLRRHIRPYLAKLPYDQAKLVQLVQGLTAELPVVTVGPETRVAAPRRLQHNGMRLPYARVAVIMRTKDRPRLLRRAVRSVLDQTFGDWLLVIVNDGGAPESVELVVDEVIDELNGRVLLLHHPTSLGMQSAANAGISQCDSDFIIIHDDDDSWQPTFLARTVSHLDENGWRPQLGGVITWSTVIVEEIGTDGEVRPQRQFLFNDQLHTLSLLELAVENRFPPISFLFHRAAFEVVGPFQEQYSVLGDWEFHLRLVRHYTVDVVPEPLANYHHRTQTTTGVYGNSVHAQTALHQAKRIELHNHAVRAELVAGKGVSMAQLLALGELRKTITDQQRSLIEQQTKEFQRLHDYIWTLEQRVNYVASQTYTVTATKRGRNLARNGDFRLWPGQGPALQDPNGQYAFAQLCPGFLLCYNGRQVTYRVERRRWLADGQTLPFGKSYLHLEHEANPKSGSWFLLECKLPASAAVASKTLTLSGIARLTGAQSWFMVGGRFDLADGPKIEWPDQALRLGSEFQRWSCTLTCPAVQEGEFTRGYEARILVKLPADQPFDFDLTDFQVEFGTAPTPFEYNAMLSWREQFALLWGKLKSYASLARSWPKPLKPFSFQEG